MFIVLVHLTDINLVEFVRSYAYSIRLYLNCINYKVLLGARPAADFSLHLSFLRFSLCRQSFALTLWFRLMTVYTLNNK